MKPTDVEIILGTAQLVQNYGIMSSKRASESGARALLAAAQQLGVRTVDTAPAYGDAEDVIGRHGTAFRVHTKLPGQSEPRRALAASLHRLRRSSVHAVHLHDPNVVLDPVDPFLEAAAELIGEGTESLGASVYTSAQFLAAVVDPRISVVQAQLNLLDRRINDDLLADAARRGTRVIVRSALLQGLLADPVRAVGRLPALDPALAGFAQLCSELGRRPVEVALGWVLARPAVTGLVIGAETPDQLAILIEATTSGALNAEELALLDSLPTPPEPVADPRSWTALDAVPMEQR